MTETESEREDLVLDEGSVEALLHRDGLAAGGVQLEGDDPRGAGPFRCEPGLDADVGFLFAHVEVDEPAIELRLDEGEVRPSRVEGYGGVRTRAISVFEGTVAEALVGHRS